MRSFIICTLRQIFYSGEIGGTCSTQRPYNILDEILKGRDQFEDLGVYGKTILE
jgi:hypothetical protein